MFELPFVSVIIVNYNGRKFIGECLDSVLESDYPNFEIIVVDNGSNDGSKEQLKKFQIANYKKQTNYKIRIIFNNRNLYFTGGSNLGAKMARGEKLIFLNSDAVVDRKFIKELVSFAGSQEKYLVQPKILFYSQKNTIDNAGGRYTFFGFGYGIGRGEIDCGQYDKDRRVDYVNGTCFMIDKNFFWKLGGFDERFRYFYEDVDLSLRAKRAGGQCWYQPKSVVYHKGGLSFKSGVSGHKILYYSLRNRLLLLAKNFFWRFQPKTPSVKPRI